MPTRLEAPPKPRSSKLRPELTRLPELTPERLAFRVRFARFCKWIVQHLTRTTFSGLENYPENGPGLLVINHLGDADIAVLLAALPAPPDGLAKVELFDFPIVGYVFERYGAIWIHRGTADRKAIRAALDGLAEGRIIGLAPEGRQSLTGSLETATSGAAYMALKAGVPIIPIALTGTQNANVYRNWLRLRRPVLTMTVGVPFRLDEYPNRPTAIDKGTDRIMRSLAELLPESYRGAYTNRPSDAA
jgi:1-acyl-sn-glycerol-3-phosphate acyltransferase